MEKLTSPRARPALARWLWDRQIPHREAAQALGCSHEHVRRICLPFDDPGRKVPNDALVDRVQAYTDGAVSKSDFEPAAAEADGGL